ncbi:MAG: ribosome-associated translation inhibitor RaiA [Chlamydiota bacterium]
MKKSQKFDNEDYKIEIHARHFPLTDAIRDYVEKKVAKIALFGKHVLEIHVVLNKEKLEHSTLIFVRFLQSQVRGKSVTGDIYSSIDKAVDKLLRLIGKYKSQLQDHHNTPRSTVDLHAHVIDPRVDEIDEINEEIEAENFAEQEALYHPHEITNSGKVQVRMLTKQEALMNMELSGHEFMIYKSEEDQKFKVLYRRRDASFGLVEIDIPEKTL